MPNSDPRRLVVSVVHSLLLALAWSHSPQAGPAPHIAGYDFVGNTFYPNDGLVNAGKIDLEKDSWISCGFTNRAGTLGWYGMNLSPGRIVKVDLTNLRKIETLVLGEGDDFLKAAVIDGNERFGYFGTATEPGKIIKIDLETMTRVGELTLPEGEGNLKTAITNPAGTVAYFGTSTAPAHIIEIDLESFSRTRSLLLPANESVLFSSVADADGQYGYFGSHTSPGKIVKVDLSDLARVGSVSLTGYTQPMQGAIEPAGVYLYYCLSAPPALARLDLTQFGQYDILNLPAGFDNGVSLMLNAGGTDALMGLYYGDIALLSLTNFQYIGSIQPQGEYEVQLIPTALRPAGLPNTGFVAYGNEPGTIVRMTISPFDRSNPLYLEDDRRIYTAVVDHDGRYGYFATFANLPSVIKIDLENLKRVGSIVLRTVNVNGPIHCSAIDAQDRFAYFGGGGTNLEYCFFKVDLDPFIHQDSIDGFGSIDAYRSIAFDEAGNRGWVGARTIPTPSQIVVRSFDANAFEIGGLENGLASSVQGNLAAAVYDPVTDYPFFASTASPALIARFRPDLAGGLATNQFPNGYDHCNTLVRHPTTGLIYAGLGDLTGQIASFNPTTLAFVDQHPGVSENGGVWSGAFPPSGEHGLFTTNERILKVRSDLSGIDGDLALPIGDHPARGLLLSPEGDRAWYGSGGEVAAVGRVNLFPRDQIKAIRIQLDQTADVDSVSFYSFAEVGPRRALVERFPRGFDAPASVAFDPTNGHALFGTSTFPGQVVKIDTKSMAVVASATLKDGSDDLRCAFMEPDGVHSCFGNYTNPGQVIRIRTSDLQVVGTLELDPGEESLRAAAVDPTGQFGYFASSNSPARIVKVALESLSRESGLILAEGEELPRTLLIDPNGDYAYVGCRTVPSQVVKIQLSDFTRVGALPFEPGENFLTSGAIDPAGEFAYFCVDTFPAKVVKVRLSDFTRVSALTLEGDNSSYGMAIDPDGRRLIVGAGEGRVSVVDLATFTREGSAQLRPLESELRQPIVIDASGENAYLGIGTYPGRVVRVELAPKPLRLGIYGNAGEEKELLWQSQPIPLSASEEWVNVPISQGNPPSLILPPDEYWLAWQVDASTKAASYAFGNGGDGLSLYWPHGAFPETLIQGTDTGWTENNDRWSVYIAYGDAPTATPTPTFTATATPSFTPSPSEAPISTSTPTPSASPEVTPSRNTYDVKPDPLDGVVDELDLLEWLRRVREEDDPGRLLLDFAGYWKEPVAK